MESFELMQNYMKREMKAAAGAKEIREARKIVSRVSFANGNNLREKAKNAGIAYDDFMKAQRIL